MGLEFSNIQELKMRVMPALTIRKKELKKQNKNYTEEEIWNYFVEIWKKSHNLTLADLVDDVLNKEITTEEIL